MNIKHSSVLNLQIKIVCNQETFWEFYMHYGNTAFDFWGIAF